MPLLVQILQASKTSERTCSGNKNSAEVFFKVMIDPVLNDVKTCVLVHVFYIWAWTFANTDLRIDETPITEKNNSFVEINFY